MPLEFGAVVLVPFPFTDQRGFKKRPAVVVSAAAYASRHPDIILMPITSQLRPSPGLGETWVEGWREAGLLKPSTIKPVIATFEQGLVLRRLGALIPTDSASLRAALREIVGG